MKRFIFILIFILPSFFGQAQNLDSLLSEPRILQLVISTPQPRLKEKFQISLDINYIRAHIFKSTIGKLQLADDPDIGDRDKMVLNVNALVKGKNEIGTLGFTLNGIKYTTNKIYYEVVDPLPDVDKGLWFRKVITSDTTFSIIIEQRIPAYGRKTDISNNSFKLTTEPEYNDVVKFKDSYSIPGLSGLDANRYTGFGSVYDKNKEQKQFMFGYSVYYFTIVDRKAAIKIKKDNLENLPAGYHFEDIIIQ